MSISRYVLCLLSMIVTSAGVAYGQNYPNKPVRIVTTEPGSGSDFVSRLIAQEMTGIWGQPVVVENRARAAGMIAQASIPREPYPTRPVRVIVPFAAGGGSDLAARLVAQVLFKELGQPFVIDNRPGAGALVGTKILVESVPDGYTIMISTSSWLTSAAMRKPAFDPINNVAPIVEFGYNPFVLAVHPSLPVKTAKEFIALARARPGELAYGHSGAGSITHLATVLFVHMAKINVLAVPYKGGGAMLPDLLAGRIEAILSGLVNVLPHAQSGRLRLLGVSTARRASELPDVPPLADAVPGYSVASWFGAVAPKGTPLPIVERLNAAINKIIKYPEFRKTAAAEGMTVTGGTTEDINKLVRGDYERWARLVKEANIKGD